MTLFNKAIYLSIYHYKTIALRLTHDLIGVGILESGGKAKSFFIENWGALSFNKKIRKETSSMKKQFYKY